MSFLGGSGPRYQYPFKNEALPGIRQTSQGLQANILGNLNNPLSIQSPMVPRTTLSNALSEDITNPAGRFSGLAEMLTNQGSARQARMGMLGSPIAEGAISRSVMTDLAPLVSNVRSQAYGSAAQFNQQDLNEADLQSTDQARKRQAATAYLSELIRMLGIGGALPSDNPLSRILGNVQTIGGMAGGAMAGIPSGAPASFGAGSPIPTGGIFG